VNDKTQISGESQREIERKGDMIHAEREREREREGEGEAEGEGEWYHKDGVAIVAVDIANLLRGELDRRHFSSRTISKHAYSRRTRRERHKRYV
jgi:hypothetical protein